MVTVNLLLPFAFGAALLVCYGIFRVVYNLYFHPLAGFPGPKLAAISNLSYAKHYTGDRWPFYLEELHRQYGDVVRYGPNDLDFATPQSFQDVHGHAKQGRKPFLKGNFYNSGDAGILGIVSQRDPAVHREIRRNLSHAFSARALRYQTDVVLQYVDMFVSQLERLGNTEKGINADDWYNWLTFDIIGDLAFGESFGMVENAQGIPWVAIVKGSTRTLLMVDIFRRIPLYRLFPSLIRRKEVDPKDRQQHLGLAREKTQKRLLKPNDRDDFFSHLLSEKGTDTSLPFLQAQAQTFVLAGSETTATALAGISYYLCENPSVLKNLTNEIRGAFSDPKAIDGDSTQSLRYLFAVIEEGLRLYPPIAGGLSRDSPGAMVDGHYVPKGTSVSTSFWTMSHREKYFHNAREFHPERWLPSDHALYDVAYSTDNKAASQPFLLGPRACLGINLAYMELRIILARIVWQFDLELSRDLDWDAEQKFALLWMKPELMIRFKPVTR